jgi:multiple antibiotic resistance protein
MYTENIPLSYIFTVLFLMLGPFKIIGPFAKITRGADARLSRQIAIQASVYSGLALIIAAFMGQAILRKYDISIPVLSLAGGIILFLVALIAIIQQFQPSTPEEETKTAPTLKLALTPLAFPTIVTPYGIATLIVFLALTPDSNGRLMIGVIVFGIMMLNLIFMLITRLISVKIFQVLAVLLQILASVLGIVQVALGLKIINKAVSVLLHQ